MTTGHEAIEDAPEYCAIEAVMEIVGGKWKMVVLNRLFGGTQRFGELRQAMPTITQRMLTRQLRELEADGLVRRTVYAQVPPKVEYDLTEVGASLRHIAEHLDSWGRWYRGRAQQRTDAATAPSGGGPQEAGQPALAGPGRAD